MMTTNTMSEAKAVEKLAMDNKAVMTVYGKELLEKELEHLIRVERTSR